MTPTSQFAGILTGLLDGTLIAALVVLGGFVNAKLRRPVPATYPVADDVPRPRRRRVAEGELPPRR